MIEVYTDGAYWQQRRRTWGAWAFRVIDGVAVREESGSIRARVSADKMEILAIVKALEIIQPSPLGLRFFCDNLNVVDGITNRLERWEALDWKKDSNGKPVSNNGYYRQVAEYLRKHRTVGEVTFQWLRRNSDPNHLAVHALASEAISKAILSENIESRKKYEE